MNRRDLLKQAGSLLLLGPALSASAFSREMPPLQCPTPAETQDLIVSVLGPFCFWQEAEYIRIMAPQIGPTCKRYPHVPFANTTCNNTIIPSAGSPAYTLQGLDSPVPRKAEPMGAPLAGFAQETCSSYDTGPQCTSCLPAKAQEAGTPKATNKHSRSAEGHVCCKALFTIELPLPDLIIGVSPECFRLPPSKPEEKHYATAVKLFYKNTKENPVILGNIKLTNDGGSPPFSFVPQFGYDKPLPAATLDFNLAPVNRKNQDHHRQFVFNKMKSMFPWISNTLSTCEPTDVPEGTAMTGHGSNCIVPLMLLS
jgi:hypothetical protein